MHPPASPARSPAPTRSAHIRLAMSGADPYDSASRTASPLRNGRVAQLVEQGIENPRVGGSIPSPATIQDSKPSKALRLYWAFLFWVVRRGVGNAPCQSAFFLACERIIVEKLALPGRVHRVRDCPALSPPCARCSPIAAGRRSNPDGDQRRDRGAGNRNSVYSNFRHTDDRFLPGLPLARVIRQVRIRRCIDPVFTPAGVVSRSRTARP